MAHHRRGLRRLLRDETLASAIEVDWRKSTLDAKRLALLTYVEALTLRPAAMRRSHVQALRDAGFEDDGILAVAEVTAYYAYVNRIADGLGVELEDPE